MRQWIAVTEAGYRQRERPMSRPFKPFSEVTKEDVVRAFFDIDDINGFMENQWGQMDWGEDANGDPIHPPMPRSSSQLTPEQIAVVIDWYHSGRYDSWAVTWDALTPISRLDRIPITRRLSRLSDLTQPLGIHWSYGTEPWPYMDSYGQHVAFGTVQNNEVDWVCTAARAMNSWQEEGEISMLPGAKVTLTKIEFGPNAVIQA